MGAIVLRRLMLPAHPYAALSRIYDATLGRRFFRTSRRVFRRLARRFGIAPRSAADLGAGTGLFAAWLARATGARVFAVERSADMLSAGVRRMCRAGVIPLRQDIRALALPQRVDLIVSNYDTINHLLRPSDVRATFAAVARCLEPGGFFVFDVISPAQHAGPARPVVIRTRRHRTCLAQRVTYDPRTRLLRVRVRITTGSAVPVTEHHVERVYPLPRLARWLGDAGLTVRGIFDAASGRPIRYSCPPRVVFVAQRTG